MGMIDIINRYQSEKNPRRKNKIFLDLLNFRVTYGSEKKSIEQIIRKITFLELSKVMIQSKKKHSEDILCECKLKLMYYLKKFNTTNKTEDHVFNYLFKNSEKKIGICVGIIKDYINKWKGFYKDNGKRKYRPSVTDTEFVNNLKDFSLNPEQIVLEAESYQILIDLIKEELTERQYYVFIQNMVYGVNQETIAEELNVSQQRVSQIKMKSINRLKKNQSISILYRSNAA